MQQVPVSLLASRSLSGMRNVLINGGFDVWQRGTVDASTDGQGFLADRWRIQVAGSSVVQTQQVFSPGQIDGDPAYHWRGAVTSVAGAGNFAQLTQAVESVRTLSGSQAVLSFWAKADATRPMSVELVQYFGTGGSPSASVNVAAAKVTLSTTWTKYTVPVTLPSLAGLTIGTNADDSLKVNFWFDAGSNFNARTGTLGQQSGTFFITRAQLEPGSDATDFEQRPIALEMSLCQRYAQVLAGAIGALGSGLFTSTTNLRAVLPLLRQMRVAPSLTTRGGSSNFQALPGALAGSALALGNASGGSTIAVDLTVTGATNNAAGILTCVNAAGSILLSAELT